MKMNLGTIDKVIRILVLVVFAVLFFILLVSGVLGIILLALAAIFVLTSMVRFCPLYWPLDINTGKKQK